MTASAIFPFPQQLEHFHQQNKIASFLCVLPNLSYHVVSTEPGSSLVTGVHSITNGSVRINGGFFAFKKQIFDYMRDGEELVIEPFQRLIAEKQLIGFNYDGFWAGMDTFKDRQQLESLWGSGNAPWHLWKDNGSEPGRHRKTCPGTRRGILRSPQRGRQRNHRISENRSPLNVENAYRVSPGATDTNAAGLGPDERRTI